MLSYALIFFVLALIAAIFGFGGVSTAFVALAKFLFFLFIVLAILSFVINFTRRTPPY